MCSALIPGHTGGEVGQRRENFARLQNFSRFMGVFASSPGRIFLCVRWWFGLRLEFTGIGQQQAKFFFIFIEEETRGSGNETAAKVRKVRCDADRSALCVLPCHFALCGCFKRLSTAVPFISPPRSAALRVSAG